MKTNGNSPSFVKSHCVPHHFLVSVRLLVYYSLARFLAKEKRYCDREKGIAKTLEVDCLNGWYIGSQIWMLGTAIVNLDIGQYSDLAL